MSAPAVTIRPVSTDDADALALLHVEVWEAAYRGLMPEHVFTERRAGLDARAARWRTIIATSPARTLVAVADDGRLLGFSSDGPGRDDDLDLPELWALYVDAAAWGTGIGHRLLAAAVGEAPASLWVLERNDRAIGFYERHGFGFDGTRRVDEVGAEVRMVRAGR